MERAQNLTGRFSAALGVGFVWASVWILTPAAAIAASEAVEIRVDASRVVRTLEPVWESVGYDEPNYTYTPNGIKLIGELQQSSRRAVYFRTHHLLTTGDASGGLKWGSTNAYTKDASGKPVYNWTVPDRIFETFLAAGAKPFVEIGFMPQALSSHPEPYTPLFRSPADFKNYYLGWSYPPQDFAKWGELVYQWARHCGAKFGRKEAEAWPWEVWNEPDISYWHGTPEDYYRLYDFAAAGLKRALPRARVGGPASTSPRNAKAAAFLRGFLAHCESGQNAATGGTGAPLDFISFHAKGAPEAADGRLRMGISAELQDAAAGFAIVRASSRFQRLSIFLTEADPEGCAACSASDVPANAYRNGALYPAYTAAAVSGLLHLAHEAQVNLAGITTWAFEFEERPYFAGYRDLATNGIDKPVLNFFRMAGMLASEEVAAEITPAISWDEIVHSGVRHGAVAGAIATRGNRRVSVLLWNYQDEDAPARSTPVRVSVTGLPLAETRLLVQQFRTDDEHSNAYSLWKLLGSPQSPSAEQYRRLEAAAQLQLADSPRWVAARNGAAWVQVQLPVPSVSLLELAW